ncbi:MAG TPA: hypothetical protein VF803_01320, partial [Candidatus Paceibacterota bacterium]
MQRFINTLILSVAVPLLVFVIPSSAYAATGISQTLSYQGVLQGSGGGNVPDGSYDMVFRIYDAAVGGTTLWTGTYTAANGNPVTVSSGLFSVQLGTGAGNTLSASVFNNGPLYLGLTVGTDSEMSPRIPLAAAPYAFNSISVNGMQFADPSYNTGDLLYVDASGKLKSLSIGSGGQVLSVAGGVPSWTATTTFGGGLNYNNGSVSLDTTGDWQGTLGGSSLSNI